MRNGHLTIRAYIYSNYIALHRIQNVRGHQNSLFLFFHRRSFIEIGHLFFLAAKTILLLQNSCHDKTIKKLILILFVSLSFCRKWRSTRKDVKVRIKRFSVAWYIEYENEYWQSISFFHIHRGSADTRLRWMEDHWILNSHQLQPIAKKKTTTAK